jgi:hypothetical protein
MTRMTVGLSAGCAGSVRALPLGRDFALGAATVLSGASACLLGVAVVIVYHRATERTRTCRLPETKSTT